MPLIVKNPELNNTPRAWPRCQSLLDKGVYPKALGFNTTRAELYRFRSRFRLAKSFKGVMLDGYATADTVNGYSSLFRVFLVWSAFEQFLSIVSLDRAATKPLCDKYGVNEICGSLRTITSHGAFLQFIRDHLDSKTQQAHLDQLIAGKDGDVSYIASSVRHIFAHGVLTPHSGAGDPQAAQGVCDVVSDFLLEIMDSEFEAIISAY